jgi:phosphomannomutase
MKINREIFRSYDIRGVVDQDLSPDFAYVLGKAFATLLQQELGNKPVVAVGYDMRPSSQSYEKALVQGLRESGAKVVRMGLVSTPAFYFGVSHLQADGGIQVSASHNPAEYNGFKLVRQGAVAMSGDTGIRQLADMMEADEAATWTDDQQLDTVESVTDIPTKQVEAELAFAQVSTLPRLKVVADSANGMGAQYLDETFKHFDFEATRMFWEFDGSFPNHEADPFKPENTRAACQKVLEVGADLGIATDGDGDRIFFIDNQGEVIEPAIVRGLVARAMLRRFPGAKIGYDIRPGKITEDLIRESGGIPVVTRVGHTHIKAAMYKDNMMFAGESSGHFYMNMPAGIFEAPVATMLVLLEEALREGATLAEVIQPLKKYAHSGEINFKVEDKQGIIQRIKEHFADGELNELDGILITYPDFWFNVRLSNTEPLLRLNLEAINQAVLSNKLAEIKAIITGS